MLDVLLARIRQGQLWKSVGGIHPPAHKTQSSRLPIARLPMPEQLIVPIKQHIGTEGKVVVNQGDTVLKGQALTSSNAHWAVPAHAPTSGKVIDITPMPSAHPSALPELSIIIEPDGQDTWCELTAYPDHTELNQHQLIDVIKNAGIAGMGGAGFPTYVKSQTQQEIDILIINGAECEPYISADDVLMQAHHHEIIRGINIMQHLLNPKLVLIAIEDDKPHAIKAMEQACRGHQGVQVRTIPTKYPSGGEKQLIQILTSLEVPAGKIPADIGVLVQNIATIHAIQQAVELGKPLIERVVTVAGNTLNASRNVWALLGTPVKHLLAEQGFTPEPQQRVIMGGPMMGFTLPTVRIPVVKTTNCILAPTEKELPTTNNEQACIRCSACADACPASLLPQQLQWFAKAKDVKKLEEHNLFDCIECGACAYVCPSEIPLVQYYRVAKAQIKAEREEKTKAERAKERFEARKERLAKEQEARRNRHSRSERTKTSTANTPQSKEKVAAALARAKAKKQATTNEDMASLRAERKAQAKRYKEEKAQPPVEQAEQIETTEKAQPNQNKQDNKKAAVAAAIARAKAKKAAQQTGDAQHADKTTNPKPADAAPSGSEPSKDKSNSEAENTAKPNDDKRKAAVAAAIARAKAKKAAQQADDAQHADKTTNPKPADAAPSGAEPSKDKSNSEAENTTKPSDDKRKAAVAAAIARAKAKKAAQQSASQAADNTDQKDNNAP